MGAINMWPLLGGLNTSSPFAIGTGVGILVGVVLRRFIPMLPILEHELTHMLAAICLFRTPIAVSADTRGGETIYTGRGSTIIRLAPYIVPTVSVFALALTPLFRESVREVTTMGVGLTWGIHLLTGLAESHPNQQDLRRGGLIRSYVAIIGLGVPCHLAVALGALGGWPLVVDWLERSWRLMTTLVFALIECTCP